MTEQTHVHVDPREAESTDSCNVTVQTTVNAASGGRCSTYLAWVLRCHLIEGRCALTMRRISSVTQGVVRHGAKPKKKQPGGKYILPKMEIT